MHFGIIIGTIGGYIYYRTREPETARNILPLLLITIGFGTIGFIDDFKKLVLRDTKGLKPAYKMLGLLIISVAYTLYLTRGIHLGTETFIPFVIFVMLGTTNAINLTDGIDGLSTSISAIIATCLTVIAIILDVKEVIVFGSIIVGSCLGFLIFNLNTARVFMGDTGSLLLRRSNCCNGFIFKDAIDIINNCFNSSSRNIICCITSNLF